MAKHSKRHNIKHKKAIADAKKSKVYTKIAKLIEIAARGGPDPKMNPSLDTALVKAKSYSIPKEIIEKAIKKGSGATQGDQLEEIFYEAYGPASSAIYIKAITSNKNRSNTNIKTIVLKMGGTMGNPGSVSRQFKEKGVIFLSGMIKKNIVKGNTIEEIIPFDNQKCEEDAIECNAEDVQIDEGTARILVSKEDFVNASKRFEELGYKVDDAELSFIPDATISLEGENLEKFERIIDALDDDDDVDTVYHNVE